MGISVEDFNKMVGKKKKTSSYLPFSNMVKKKPVKSKGKNLVRKLDEVFSKYIRLRDASDHGTFRCISCGKVKAFRKADCGHFYSRMHMSTRYDEDNCHAECAYCNRISADHLIGYQEHLIEKIGQERFDKLRLRHHLSKKWSDFEMEEMIKHYKAEVARLSAEKGIRI